MALNPYFLSPCSSGEDIDCYSCVNSVPHSPRLSSLPPCQATCSPPPTYLSEAAADAPGQAPPPPKESQHPLPGS